MGQYVVFDLGKQNYALPVRNVREIVPVKEITKVPHAPEHVAGIVDIRGLVIPVIDLHKRFSLADWQATDDSRIMVVESSDEDVGFLVDSVSEVVHIQEDEIGEPSGLLKGKEGDYLIGVANLEEKLILVLDLEKVVGEKLSELEV